MTKNDLNRLNFNGSESTSLGKRTPLEYATMMEELRGFGWAEFGIPHIYGMDFGKNKDKVCLYMETPDNLPKASQEQWVKKLINVNSGTQDISFTQIPDKPNKPKKPRFNAFKVIPTELMQVAHKAPDKPMVIVAGDAQIGFHHVLAHGITDGVARADEMIKNIECYSGEIAYFEPDEYARSIKGMLKRHKDKIVEHYHARAQYFQTWLYEAEKHYTVAIQQVKGSAQEAVFQKTLKEIQARIHYDKAQKLRASLYDATGKIAFDKVNHDTLAAQLRALNTHLSKALENLPVRFIKERQNALNLLKETANSFKELGNQYFKKQALLKAATAYESALNIYQEPLLANQHHVDELTLYSNLIITLRKDNQNDKALTIAVHAIENYPPTAALIPVKTKIMFNLINALTALKSAKDEDIDVVYAPLVEQAKKCVMDNPHLLTPALKAEFERLFPEKNKTVHAANFATGVGPGFFHRQGPAAASNTAGPILVF